MVTRKQDRSGRRSGLGRVEPGNGRRRKESSGWGPRDCNGTPRMALGPAAPPADPAWAHSLSSLAKLLCRLRESQGHRPALRTSPCGPRGSLRPPSWSSEPTRPPLVLPSSPWLQAESSSNSVAPLRVPVLGSGGAWTEGLEGHKLPRWPLSLSFPLVPGFGGLSRTFRP